MMNGYIFIIHLCCLFLSCQVAAFGESCTDNSVCTGNTVCSDGNCTTCAAGYQLKTAKNGCEDINECNIGTSNCHSKADCTNNEGSFTCKCKPGYSGNGVSCTDSNECKLSNSCHRNAVCKNRQGGYTCTCKSGYSGDGYHCRDINECNLSNNCHRNAVCKNHQGGYTCTCKSGYSGDGYRCGDINECVSSPCKYGGTCSNLINAYRCTCTNGYSGTNCQVASLGSSCSQSGTFCADPNASCQSNGGGLTCKCKNNYYDNDGVNNIGGTCTSKIELGYTGCSRSVTDSCLSPHATCQTNGYCTCDTGYYDSNGNTPKGTCKKKVNVGSTGCSTSVTDSCKDVNAECKINYGECTCKSNYYDDKNSNSNLRACQNRKILGKSCSSLQNECADGNAECLDDKCTCGPNYYDSNGFVDGGSCKSVNNLRVNSISFAAVTTSGFKVSWTSSSSTAQIDHYEVIWSCKTPVNSPIDGNSVVAKSSTSFVISTGVTAGKTYIVKVMSVNTDTRKDHSRTTFLSNKQASKPNKPRSLTTSDLDARDKSITIGWSAPSSGVATSYRIQLFDDTTQLTSKDQSSTTANIYYENMKNGYRYDVKISARSEVYWSSQYEWSDLYVEQITTTVQVPSAPRDVRCDIVKDESITLKWLKPLLPNGDLVRYNIEVFSATDQLLFSTNTAGVVESHQITRLSPGTSYMFKVYSQNVMYNSSQSAQSNICTTKVKLSDPPSDFQTIDVTSRNFSIRWNEPINSYSEEIIGYVIQLKVKSTCVEEIVYKCSTPSCRQTFEPSSLFNMCDSSVRNLIPRSKSQLSGVQSYTFSNLLPDTTYNIIGAAVNYIGAGNTVDITITTAEEAPQRPYNVLVNDIQVTSLSVTWDIADPRPGKTNYTVTLTADSPAELKEFIMTGFTSRTYNAEKLEEYWYYSVTVTATTSKGSKTSYKTGKYRTLPAAPGKVSNFVVTTTTGGNNTLMKISWQAPDILLQNSVIKSYSFMYYPEQKRESTIVKTLDHHLSQSYHYETIVSVIPDTSYTFEVFAINDQNMTGEKYIVTKIAPAAEPSADKSDSQTATVIVSVVLGAIILVLSIYAVYTTLVIRRYKKKEDDHEIAKHLKSKSPIYVNESFMTGVAEIGERLPTGISNYRATAENAETEYLRLDESTRDDKETYDRINCL